MADDKPPKVPFYAQWSEADVLSTLEVVEGRVYLDLDCTGTAVGVEVLAPPLTLTGFRDHGHAEALRQEERADKAEALNKPLLDRIDDLKRQRDRFRLLAETLLVGTGSPQDLVAKLLTDAAGRLVPFEAALRYEIRASWWAHHVPWRWAQRWAAKYFAWKTRRKHRRYVDTSPKQED